MESYAANALVHTSLTGIDCTQHQNRNQPTAISHLVQSTKKPQEPAFTLQQRRHSQLFHPQRRGAGRGEWKQLSLFRLKVQKCFYHQMRIDGQDFGQFCVRRGQNKLQSVLAVCAGDTLLALLHFPLYQQQCIGAFPDTGQLSDRRLLWSGCQTLIWANIEEHSAIASMIAASCSPLWASRHVNKSESTYLEMFSNFAFLLSHFHQLLIRVNESRIKANLPTTN